jgi:hypothetical protein
VRSTVYDRAKETGFLSSRDRGPVKAPVKAVSMTVAAPKEEAEEFPPSSDDEPLPTDAAEEEHHGTMKKPVDLVGGKLIIRLDDGQLYELKKLQEPGGAAGGYDSFGQGGF